MYQALYCVQDHNVMSRADTGCYIWYRRSRVGSLDDSQLQQGWTDVCNSDHFSYVNNMKHEVEVNYSQLYYQIHSCTTKFMAVLSFSSQLCKFALSCWFFHHCFTTIRIHKTMLCLSCDTQLLIFPTCSVIQQPMQ